MDYVERTHRGVAKLIHRFQRNPFDFLYERDLQSLLFSLLLHEFEGESIVMKGGRRPIAEYGEGDTIRTVPVKSEYRGFDIAILDPHTIRSYEEAQSAMPGLQSDAFWHQALLAAIELKYCQIGDRPRDRLVGVRADVEKLRQYRILERADQPFLGLSLLFVQSASQDLLVFEEDKGAELGDDPKTGIARYVVSARTFRRFSV